MEKQVECGYTIVTWNGLSFDFDVLAEESGMIEKCRTLAINHVDMMFHALCRLGHGISLDSAAKGMDLLGKNEDMTGILALSSGQREGKKKCSNTWPTTRKLRWNSRRSVELRGFFVG